MPGERRHDEIGQTFKNSGFTQAVSEVFGAYGHPPGGGPCGECPCGGGGPPGTNRTFPLPFRSFIISTADGFLFVENAESSRVSLNEPQLPHLRRQKRHSAARSRKELTQPHFPHLYSYKGILS